LVTDFNNILLKSKKDYLKNIENHHSELDSESHHTDNQSLWEPESSSGWRKFYFLDSLFLYTNELIKITFSLTSF